MIMRYLTENILTSHSLLQVLSLKTVSGWNYLSFGLTDGVPSRSLMRWSLDYEIPSQEWVPLLSTPVNLSPFTSTTVKKMLNISFNCSLSTRNSPIFQPRFTGDSLPG